MRLRVHDAQVALGDPPPSGRRLRVHGAAVLVTVPRVPRVLRVHRVLVATGTATSRRGGWWVRLAGQWVRHRARVRVGGQWR